MDGLVLAAVKHQRGIVEMACEMLLAEGHDPKDCWIRTVDDPAGPSYRLCRPDGVAVFEWGWHKPVVYEADEKLGLERHRIDLFARVVGPWLEEPEA